MELLLDIAVFVLGVCYWYGTIHRQALDKIKMPLWWLLFLVYAVLVFIALYIYQYSMTLWFGGGALLGGLSGAFANDWAKGKWRFWRRQGSK